MHRLFWKIFIAFWAALILFLFATLWIASGYIERMRAEHNPHQRITNMLEDAQYIANSSGVTGLRIWLEKVEQHEPIPILLVNEEGIDLLDRPVPDYIISRMKRRQQNRSQHKGPPHRRMLSGKPLIRLADGQQLMLVPNFKGVTLSRVLHRPRAIAMPLIVAALISGLVCLLLARYITSPIHKLAGATRNIAAGDLTQRVSPSLGRRKDEIADLASDFDQMAIRLEQLLGSHKQLLRDASHELRSPLARLQVALGLARQQSASGNESQLDRIEHEAERLNNLIGQLLSLAKLESGNISPKYEEVEMGELLKAIIEDASFESSDEARKIQFKDDSHCSINADKQLLHSAIENVIRNAIKYTPAGSAVELTLEQATDEQSCRITIRDHGPGIPEDILPRLFEPFVRVGEARDRQSGGYGLGLAIAERAVRLHGGEISAKNEEDGGIRVTITLPAGKA